MKKDDKIINAIASGKVERLKDIQKQNTGRKIVIGSFLEHMQATTSGQLDNPNIEVEFADTPYTRAIIEMVKKEDAKS